MKQRELAEKTGVNEHTLSALVSERRPPSMEVAYKIAHALDLNVMEIWIYKPE
ncbi:helix-turn-helix domain-containing protein [Paenibacillus sp. RUD330]|uniref:helix-turn-helix transcriptional regulator n=1 Tax=Paenibacillus sp. RUD330 TaxID=2023772 RepID=UPI001F117610|nr:helix-turn-helix domain-containing protein [Paenibacillus sp. RUD330]